MEKYFELFFSLVKRFISVNTNIKAFYKKKREKLFHENNEEIHKINSYFVGIIFKSS